MAIDALRVRDGWSWALAIAVFIAAFLLGEWALHWAKRKVEDYLPPILAALAPESARSTISPTA
jgi:hypothetical protein